MIEEKVLPNRKQPGASGKGSPAADLPLETGLFAPGDRVCVAVSGGADSTALLRGLLVRRPELGIVLSVLHVDHGLRGAAAAGDAAFVVALAEAFHLPYEVVPVDTPKRAREEKESIEEAARNLRYHAFRLAVASGRADKIATAHTLDDQAETVLMKLLRGAWTEGLSGIHPVLPLDESGHACVRPLLNATRTQIEEYLRNLGQPWRQDETNDSPDYTRNRVRHELLPAMRKYNPRVAQALAHIAENARAEEQHWKLELARLLPQLLLPGKPVRGGGRSVPTGEGMVTVSVEIARLQALDPGLRRRVLRAVAERCGSTLDFEATERLLAMIREKSHSPRTSLRTSSTTRLDLPGGLTVARSARELQFERQPVRPPMERNPVPAQYRLPIPGAVEAPAFHARFSAVLGNSVGEAAHPNHPLRFLPPAVVRAWQPGDRVELAHSSGPKKVKEVLERMGIRGEERAFWPVVAWQGQIVWMRGVQIPSPQDGIQILVEEDLERRKPNNR